MKEREGTKEERKKKDTEKTEGFMEKEGKIMEEVENELKQEVDDDKLNTDNFILSSEGNLVEKKGMNLRKRRGIGIAGVTGFKKNIESAREMAGKEVGLPIFQEPLAVARSYKKNYVDLLSTQKEYQITDGDPYHYTHPPENFLVEKKGMNLRRRGGRGIAGETGFKENLESANEMAGGKEVGLPIFQKPIAVARSYKKNDGDFVEIRDKLSTQKEYQITDGDPYHYTPAPEKFLVEKKGMNLRRRGGRGIAGETGFKENLESANEMAGGKEVGLPIFQKPIAVAGSYTRREFIQRNLLLLRMEQKDSEARKKERQEYGEDACNILGLQGMGEKKGKDGWNWIEELLFQEHLKSYVANLRIEREERIRKEGEEKGSCSAKAGNMSRWIREYKNLLAQEKEMEKGKLQHEIEEMVKQRNMEEEREWEKNKETKRAAAVEKRAKEEKKRNNHPEWELRTCLESMHDVLRSKSEKQILDYYYNVYIPEMQREENTRKIRFEYLTVDPEDSDQPIEYRINL